LQRELEGRDARIHELQSQLARPAVTVPVAGTERRYSEDGHVLLVQSDAGYVTIERTGPAPHEGEAVELPIGRYEVSRRGPSPFPADARACAYLIHA
jgi:hypothetical protein